MSLHLSRDQMQATRGRLDGDSSKFQLALLSGFGLSVEGSTVTLPLSSQRLLAFLAVQQQPVRRLFVAGMLWSDTTEERSLANLRSLLWRLNETASDLVDASATSLRLSPGVCVDLAQTSLLAHRLLRDSDRVSDAELTPDLFLDDLLPDWYEDWIVLERERFRQLRMHALEAIALRFIDEGKFAGAVGAAQAAVAAEPLRESAHRILIRVHLAEGNPVEAIREYRLFSKLLADELGLEPSPKIRQLLSELCIS